MNRIVLAVGVCVAIGLTIFLTFVGMPAETRSSSVMVTGAENAKPMLEQASHSLPVNSVEPNTTSKEFSVLRVENTSLEGKESIHEKMNRLLSSVSSRETALVYLQGVLDQGSAMSARADQVPVIEIVSVWDPSSSSKAPTSTLSGGRMRVEALIDGVRGFHEIPLFPAELIPSQVRAFLSEDDVREFQYRMIVSNIEASAIKRKRARPTK